MGSPPADKLGLPAALRPGRAATAVPDSHTSEGGREAGHPITQTDREGRSRRWRGRRFREVSPVGFGGGMVVAEETYYAENGVYARIWLASGSSRRSGRAYRFLWVSRTGWAVSGTPAGVPGQDCVIFVGRGHGAPTTLRDLRSAPEGVPICDGARPPRRPPPPRAQRPRPRPWPRRPAGGGRSAGKPAPADTESALNAVEPRIQMRVDLRNLVRSQDTWYAQQGAYAKRTEPFALQYLWHRGVKITILSATDDAWSARATHTSFPGKSCVIWLGPVSQKPATDVEKKVPDQPGVPVCDD